ncbi:MAG: STAS domain-containing protein [Candidatus Competibacteraceae bacterium]|nr:STAS domain-containing protein [Candidatus Competibacteraceae bacterium]
MAAATAERDGDTLRVRGELDFDSVPELWEATETLLLADTIRRVDLGGVRRANSAGVALLVEWLRETRGRGRELVFVNLPAQMEAIVRTVDLDGVLPVA